MVIDYLHKRMSSRFSVPEALTVNSPSSTISGPELIDAEGVIAFNRGNDDGAQPGTREV